VPVSPVLWLPISCLRLAHAHLTPRYASEGQAGKLASSYSPNVVEVEFSEVRGSKRPHSGGALAHWDGAFGFRPYNASIVGRIILYLLFSMRPSLCLLEALRWGVGSATMTTPGGAGTPRKAHLQLSPCSAHRLLSWGRSANLRPFFLPIVHGVVSRQWIRPGICQSQGVFHGLFSEKPSAPPQIPKNALGFARSFSA
jgi:hypothetical protein